MSAAAAVLPPTLPESGEAKRFVERGSGSLIAKVLPGKFYVTNQQESIVTVLGSCIAACVRDPVAGIGGMNHFMLPVGDAQRAESWGQEHSSENRFGNYAMENLINTILKHGGSKSHLEVKIFGGGHVLDISSDVGAKNARFAIEYLEVEGYRMVSSDTGGTFARKIIYDPLSGRVRLKRIREVYNGYIATQERQLLQSPAPNPEAGTIELFD
ncbi:MAG: chemoreceptor glutamine deamidase CheD [Gammaproteobacteria bacterium]